MSIYKIRARRDLAATWTSKNPVLGLGEIGFETDTRKLKIGDGSSSWTVLDYVAYDVGAHTQEISTVNGLQAALNAKANSSHAHSISDVSNLQSTINNLAPLSHTHNISDVTNLQASLDNKSDVGHGHSISDISTLQDALNGKAEIAHTHAYDEIGAPGINKSVLYNFSGGIDSSSGFLYDYNTNHLIVDGTIQASGVVISPHFQGALLGAVQCPVKNTSGGVIGKGVPVYVTGTVGSTTTLEIAIARADDPTKMPALGLLETQLSANATGHVTILGTLSTLNTSSFSVGNTVYVGPTGGLVNTRPTGVNLLVQNIGRVGRSNSNNGEIIVTGPGRTNDVPNNITLDSLSDVQTSGVSSGQALVYNGSYWAFGSVSASGSSGGGFVTSGSPPATGSASEGYRWLDANSGIEFTLVNDGNGLQWVELPSVNYAGGSSGSSGAGITDGDKGEITVSASGTVWTIDSGVIGTSKLGVDITTAGKQLLDDADAAAQRTTLGLGSAALSSTGDFAQFSHTHPITDLIASGSPSSTKFLRGDSYWVAPTIYDSITVTIESSPYVISTGSKGFKTIPYDCEITDWYIISKATGSVEFDVKRSSYANYPSTTSIIGSTGERPIISNGIKNKYESVTSFSGLYQGDVLEFYILNCSGLQNVSLCMKTRSV